MATVVVIVWAMVCCATMIEVWLGLRSYHRRPTASGPTAAVSDRESRRWLLIPTGAWMGAIGAVLGLVYGTIEVQAFVLSPSLINMLPVVPLALLLVGGSLVLWGQRH